MHDEACSYVYDDLDRLSFADVYSGVQMKSSSYDSNGNFNSMTGQNLSSETYESGGKAKRISPVEYLATPTVAPRAALRCAPGATVGA